MPSSVGAICYYYRHRSDVATSSQAFVEALLRDCGNGAQDRHEALSDLPHDAPTSLNMAWADVRAAYVLRQHAAALLLGSAFIELLLRTLLPSKSNLTLQKMIGKATETGMVQPEDGEKLQIIRSCIRNRYAHGLYEEIAGAAPVKITKMQVKSGAVTSVEVVTCTTADYPFLQARQKKTHDALFASKTLPHIHRIALQALQWKARQEEI